VTKTKLHDHGCTLKAYKADALKQLNLYGDMHRMIAAYAGLAGAKVAEVPVSWYHKETERINPIKDSFEGLRDLLKVRINALLGKYRPT